MASAQYVLARWLPLGIAACKNEFKQITKQSKHCIKKENEHDF